VAEFQGEYALSDTERALVEVRKPIDYVDRYQEFLESTDEKQIIAQAVGHVLSDGSILDIGAGTGDITDMLRLDKDRYTALEQRPEFVTQLREKGYQVIDRLFPCFVPKKYDNVLMSYILHSKEQCEVMINPAWEVVDDGGQLIVVTFRDNDDDYNQLLHATGHTRRVTTDSRFNYLQEKFASLGELTVSHTTSHIYSNSAEKLAHSLSFVATNTVVGTPELRQELFYRMISDEILLEPYKEENGEYRFPMEHYVFTTYKSREV